MMMLNNHLAVALVVTGALSTTVHSLACSSGLVECSGVANNSFQVCAVNILTTTPSPTRFEDGMAVYTGGYRQTYEIVQGLSQGLAIYEAYDYYESQEILNKALAGITVDVHREDNVCTITVSMNGESTECKSCSYCGNNAFSADCTNLPNGRVTECERSTVVSYECAPDVTETHVFFPLTENALPVSDFSLDASAVPMMPGTQAPTESPINTTAVSNIDTNEAPTKTESPVMTAPNSGKSDGGRLRLAATSFVTAALYLWNP